MALDNPSANPHPAPPPPSEPPSDAPECGRPFLLEWLNAPLQVAAVRPSSDQLARLITREIGPHTGPVIELGPGNGVFTDALLARGVKERDLALVEKGARFAGLLARRYPDARLYPGDAAILRRALPFGPFGAGAIVSGLPLLSMPARTIYAILSGALRNLAPGGAIHQFTYGYRPPVPPSVLARLDLRAERTGTVLRNLPPASVYRITRREPLPPRD